ncbi:unnamed protein product [Chrysodeixis includens]|uniref:Gag-like protein n=1 Tax=Chrysodeixis includens TaxID=689277 RepID=A0A9N8Q2X8_CHRIL|nr:unnamed protein product [Chrysodeixis includens]
MFRTPSKPSVSKTPSPGMDRVRAGPSRIEDGTTSTTERVRKSIGEWESGSLKTPTSPEAKVAKRDLPKPKATLPKMVTTRPSTSPKTTPTTSATITATDKYKNRTSEAKACLQKGNRLLEAAKNLKTEIKEGVKKVLERMYQIVKEAEADDTGKTPKPLTTTDTISISSKLPSPPQSKDSDWAEKLAENTKLLIENSKKVQELQDMIAGERKERATYASVVASKDRREAPQTLHSLVVTSTDVTDTGEQVLDKIRKVARAKEGEINIEKVRKGRDRKIIIGCSSLEERQKAIERLGGSNDQLKVEAVANKNPLVIMRDVMAYNSNEEIVQALRCQNADLLRGLEDQNIEVKYRRRTRNSLTTHVVAQVSPQIYGRMMSARTVRIDLQSKVQVADQSPLVQCSMCLGYGHNRRFCKQTIEKCSHCGGPHLKQDCADWLAGVAPSCTNCRQAKLDNAEHNAFSGQCPVRRKWDSLARANIAYC